jgi:hypothetical protein
MECFSERFEAGILRSTGIFPTVHPAETRFLAPDCSLSQSACAAFAAVLHSIHPLTLSGVLRRNKMTYLTQHAHQVIALVLAVVITAGIQGSLLAGFEQLASAAPAPVVVASCE